MVFLTYLITYFQKYLKNGAVKKKTPNTENMTNKIFYKKASQEFFVKPTPVKIAGVKHVNHVFSKISRKQ